MECRILSDDDLRARGFVMPPNVPSYLKIKVIGIPLLKKPYLPENFHMVESLEIRGRWENHLKTIILSDPRDWRRPLTMFDPSRLQYDVQEGECIIFIDEVTSKTCLIVIQNLTNDRGVLKSFDATVHEQMNKTNESTQMRRDDPICMVGVGYTPGERHNKAFQWGKNLGKHNTAEHGYKMSCMCAHCWKLCLQVFPQEVIDDFESADKKTQGIRMDNGAMGKADHPLQYTIITDGVERDFATSLLAPPTATVARNYARYTHNDENLNKFCVSLTTCRTHGLEHGGNFYSAAYGVRIPGRADQLVVWCGRDLHGTTLPNLDPLEEDPEFNQSGLAFILPNTLPAAVENVLKNAKKKRKAGVIEEDTMDTASIQSVYFHNTDIQPKQEATMPLQTQQEGKKREDKVYQEDRIPTYTLPGTHQYEKMSRKALFKLMKQRAEEDNMEKAIWSWSNARMMYELLKNDGVDVSVTWTDKPMEKRRQHKQAMKLAELMNSAEAKGDEE